MTENYLEKACCNCKFHNPDVPPLYCDFTLDNQVSIVRCSILKENIKSIKFKEKLV